MSRPKSEASSNSKAIEEGIVGEIETETDERGNEPETAFITGLANEPVPEFGLAPTALTVVAAATAAAVAVAVAVAVLEARSSG